MADHSVTFTMAPVLEGVEPPPCAVCGGLARVMVTVDGYEDRGALPCCGAVACQFGTCMALAADPDPHTEE